MEEKTTSLRTDGATRVGMEYGVYGDQSMEENREKPKEKK